jgi:hypothetical protein
MQCTSFAQKEEKEQKEEENQQTLWSEWGICRVRVINVIFPLTATSTATSRTTAVLQAE